MAKEKKKVSRRTVVCVECDRETRRVFGKDFGGCSKCGGHLVLKENRGKIKRKPIGNFSPAEGRKHPDCPIPEDQVADVQLRKFISFLQKELGECKCEVEREVVSSMMVNAEVRISEVL